MANMNLNVNMENLKEEERNQLLALIKKSTEEKPKVWKPKNGEVYYFINAIGKYEPDVWHGIETDEDMYIFGNCFKTEEEAEFAIEKQKVITEMKRFAQKHNEKIDWNNEYQNKYYLYYDHECECVLIDKKCYMKTSTIYFSSIEIAQQAIETIGADRLIKYYFEVED